MTKVVEQICIIRAIETNGSNLTLSLEPKKQQCEGCNGRCAKMLKPTELIKIDQKISDYSLNEEVVLYMDKSHLRNLIISILGLPLFALLLIVILGTIFNFNEIQIIVSIFLSLLAIFALQVKYLNFSNQMNIKKYNKDS